MGSVDLEALRDVMPPPKSGGDALDWSVLEGEFGVCFPGDYKLFMEAYGGGTIDETLSILPLTDGASEWRSEYLNADGYLFAEDIEAELGIEIPGEDPPEGLLVPWGVAPSGAVGCWFASGDDPDQWPVVVFRNRAHPTWFRYDHGFVGFLRSVIAGELDNTFGIMFPMWPGGADYLNRKDRAPAQTARHLHAGLHPPAGGMLRPDARSRDRSGAVPAARRAAPSEDASSGMIKRRDFSREARGIARHAPNHGKVDHQALCLADQGAG